MCCFTPDSADLGSALGPDWHQEISLRGAEEVCELVYLSRKTILYFSKYQEQLYVFYSQVLHNVHVEYECEIEQTYSQQDFMQSPLYKQDSDFGNTV